MYKISVGLLILILSFSHRAFGQGDIQQVPADNGRRITLEDIWASNKLTAKTIPGFQFAGDEKRYLQKIDNKILAFDITTGKVTDTILDASLIPTEDDRPFQFSSYYISDDGKRFLLETQVERIYRRSVLANYFVWDTETGQLSNLFEEDKQQYPQFDPSGMKVAFLSQNNLYIKNLVDGTIKQVTTDGKANEIINGGADWVYEEEFRMTRAFEWSPEGNFLAFIKFDEREVPEFTMELYGDELYPRRMTYKYPKVGERNSKVSIWVYHLESEVMIRGDIGSLEDIYLPKITWSNAPERVTVYKLNRHQNHLELFSIHPVSGNSALLLEERNPYYISVDNYFSFLETKRWFIWSSEQSGYNHLYLYDMNGRLIRQLTSGDFDVTGFYGVDEARERIYFQAADESPMTRNIYYVNFEGEGMTRLNQTTGSNNAQFSSTFDYWANTYSTINMPPVYSVFDIDGKLVREIETNEALLEQMGVYKPIPAEFFSFVTEDQVKLNGFMIYPSGFDTSKKYPVFMFTYGGPNSQKAADEWFGANYWWFQLLAQEGYLVACVDNRGTAARGQEFRKITYLQLGHFETIDQIAAAKYLGSLTYTDASRIGIFGWSYGGYLSSLCLLKGNDVFKAAIAVAPVTNWKWYNSVYTERFMLTVDENPDGYKNNSPVYFADRLKGNYLLIHGMADDNVHFQHTAEMADALIRANKQFDSAFYPNKNHGIYGGQTRLHLYTLMTNFIKEKL